MREDAIADLHDDRAMGLEARVRPAGRERSGAPFRLRRHPSEGCRIDRAAAAVAAPSVQARERGRRAGGHVPKIEGGVHDLVVAKHRDELSPGRRRLRFEPLGEVEDGAVIVPPVDFVPRLNHHERASNPVIRGVDRPRQTKRPSRMVEVPVKIADRDQPSRRRARDSRGERRDLRARQRRERKLGRSGLTVLLPDLRASGRGGQGDQRNDEDDRARRKMQGSDESHGASYAATRTAPRGIDGPQMRWTSRTFIAYSRG